jgi:Domain of unknown function (DUF4263)
MDRINTKSTSKLTATATDIVLREGPQTRLLFRPEIVDNTGKPEAAVRGRFLYHKKKRNDQWMEFEKLPLTSIKMDEGYQLEIKSGELYKLLLNLRQLYQLANAYGVPQGRKSFFEIRGALADMLALADVELQEFLMTNSEDAMRLFRLLLMWMYRKADSTTPESLAQLLEFNEFVGLENLKSLVNDWDAHKDEKREEFWQSLFAKHSAVLSQLFAYPVLLIKDKAYLGGKDLTNAGGHIIDFLCKLESTGAAAMIEIKTPLTDLLASEYRDGIYPISNDLTGAIAQALRYKSSLAENLQNLQRGEQVVIPSEPYCVIVAGDCCQLNSRDKKISFEAFRERLHGVRLLTFDEVYSRVQSLLSLLRDNSAIPS